MALGYHLMLVVGILGGFYEMTNCHIIDGGVDTGAILEYSTSLAPKGCNLPIEIEKFRLKKFLVFYEMVIKKIINNFSFTITSQPSYLSRYNPRVYTKLNGWIDWGQSSLNLSRFIDAFDDPYDGAMTYINKQKVHIKKTQQAIHLITHLCLVFPGTIVNGLL